MIRMLYKVPGGKYFKQRGRLDQMPWENIVKWEKEGQCEEHSGSGGGCYLLTVVLGSLYEQKAAESSESKLWKLTVKYLKANSYMESEAYSYLISFITLYF